MVLLWFAYGSARFCCGSARFCCGSAHFSGGFYGSAHFFVVFMVLLWFLWFCYGFYGSAMVLLWVFMVLCFLIQILTKFCLEKIFTKYVCVFF